MHFNAFQCVSMHFNESSDEMKIVMSTYFIIISSFLE